VPAAIVPEASDSAARVLFGEYTFETSLKGIEAAEAFVIVVVTETLAMLGLATSPLGTVDTTYVPQGATCSWFAILSQTCLYIPPPSYHHPSRWDGSTETVSMFDFPNITFLLMSYRDGVYPLGCSPSFTPFKYTIESL